VLKDDPIVRIATGDRVAPDVESPRRQGASPKAPSGPAAIDDARRIGSRPTASATTSMRRRVLPGLHDTPRAGRQVARAQGVRGAGQEIPSDDEAQIFSALYLAGTQTQADQTYARVPQGGGGLEESSGSIPTIPASRTT
jgi:hypothetical protein